MSFPGKIATSGTSIYHTQSADHLQETITPHRHQMRQAAVEAAAARPNYTLIHGMMG